MTDYTELKRLAEAAQEDPNSPYLPCPVAFMNAATPSVVLALIAESERIKARLCVCRDCGGQGEICSGHSSYQGHNQPPEPDMDVCGTCGGDGVLGPLEDFESLAAERDQLKAENERLEVEVKRMTSIAYAAHGAFRMETMAERDQLRAEVAGLRTGYEAYEQVNAELKAEVEKLRKELAARHPFKFAQESPAIGFTGCVICGVYTDHGGLPCPKTRATAIAHAAMGKGERS